MNAQRTVSDSVLAALASSRDPAVSVHSSSDAIRFLIQSYLIDDRHTYELLGPSDRIKVANSVARDVLGVLNALQTDSLRLLVLHGGSMSAKLEVSQDSWHEHHGSIADAAQLLLDVSRELPQLSFLLRPVRKGLLSGGFKVHNYVDVAEDATIPSRLAILQHVHSSGLRARLMDVYRPYQPQRFS